ncbi:MAG: aldehyde ferredoxin oxidoreductase family protein [Actinomycetota bacterium]|nr:aldehyde ferredoxin oxidoreductase family protein [Actinomycetota bacterium]
MFGYQGKILHVHLDTGETRVEALPEEIYRKYIGGVGLATYLIHINTKPKIDPLGPENVLAFASGPLVGTFASMGDKYVVVAKSPLTGFIGDSISSSSWSRELKRAGHDGLVIHGRAENPTYLFIDDGNVYFKEAGNIWGEDVWTAEEKIRGELEDKNVGVISIGPAGEKLVLFANIMSDGRHAGRSGLGAVMGSKNLKAIAVRGTGSIRVANLRELSKLCLGIYEKAQGPNTEKYRVEGTPTNVLSLNAHGCLPTRNWQQSTFESAEEISGAHFLKNHTVSVTACSSCPVACAHNCVVKGGPYAGAAVSLDYEGLYAMGPDCGVGDSSAIIKALELCDFYGMDSISAGVTCAWAMECYEKGLLTKEETDGLELTFGNHEALIQLIHKIAAREGIGDMLASGVKRASERLGRGSEHLAIHIKGLELPGYDIRSLKTAALGWAVAARGGCHNRSGAYEPDLKGKVDRFKAEKGRGRLVMESEGRAAVLDSLTMCKFLRACLTDFYPELAKLYELVTGFGMSGDDLRRAGERIINLKKLYNIREGWTQKDDHLPPRVMEDPVPDGVAKGSLVTRQELDLLLDDYYEAQGWTRDGTIPKEKLNELGISVGE